MAAKGRFDSFTCRHPNGRFRREGVIGQAAGDGQLSTHNGSSLRLPSTAGLGHLAAVRIAVSQRVKSTHNGRSSELTRSACVAPFQPLPSTNPGRPSRVKAAIRRAAPTRASRAPRARRFEQAIDWADRSLHNQPRHITAIRIKIVANAHLGRLDEARG
jgi:hypothetical protein